MKTTGRVEYGILKEIGIPSEDKEVPLSGKEVTIELDGVKYCAIIK